MRRADDELIDVSYLSFFLSSRRFPFGDPYGTCVNTINELQIKFRRVWNATQFFANLGFAPVSSSSLREALIEGLLQIQDNSMG